jgi:hypothetical protein
MNIQTTICNWLWWLVLPFLVALIPFSLFGWLLGLIADHADDAYHFYTFRLFGWLAPIGRWVHGRTM